MAEELSRPGLQEAASFLEKRLPLKLTKLVLITGNSLWFQEIYYAYCLQRHIEHTHNILIQWVQCYQLVRPQRHWIFLLALLKKMKKNVLEYYHLHIFNKICFKLYKILFKALLMYILRKNPKTTPRYCLWLTLYLKQIPYYCYSYKVSFSLVLHHPHQEVKMEKKNKFNFLLPHIKMRFTTSLI